jgi:hypothetical protein
MDHPHWFRPDGLAIGCPAFRRHPESAGKFQRTSHPVICNHANDERSFILWHVTQDRVGN